MPANVRRAPFFLPFFVLLLFATLVFLPIDHVSATEDGGIELPVEFFFGRWAPGLAVNAQAFLEKEQHPRWGLGGIFATEQFHAGLFGLTGQKFPDAFGYDANHISCFFQYRPTGRWQVGLDDFSYEKADMSTYLPLTGMLDSDEFTSFTLSSRMSKTESVSLTKPLAKYVYAGGRAVGPKQFLWANSLSYHRSEAKHIYSHDVLIFPFENWERMYELQSDFLYGLSNSAVIRAGFRAPIDKTRDRYVTYYTYPNPTYIEERVDIFSPQFQFSTLLVADKNAFVLVYLEQEFQKISEESDRTDDGVVQLTSDTEYSLRNHRTRVGFELSNISDGSFDPEIILDDYLGYYRGLLFPGQHSAHLGFYYENLPDRHEPSDKNAEILAAAGFGLGHGLEVGGQMAYDWSRTWITYYAPEYQGVERSQERLRWSLGLRWRSYDYRPGRGSGWDRDSAMDIAFGPMLQPGKMYLGLLYLPPALQSAGDVSFLSLQNLTGSNVHTLVLTLEAGMASEFTLAGRLNVTIKKDDWSYYYSDTDEAEVAIGVRKRCRQSLQFGVEMTKIFEGGPDDPARFTFTTAGMFW